MLLGDRGLFLIDGSGELAGELAAGEQAAQLLLELVALELLAVLLLCIGEHIALLGREGGHGSILGLGVDLL